jgi:autotransporter-associated beta strand protein
MRKVYVFLCLFFGSAGVFAQTNNYFGTTGTINGTVWSIIPAGPYTSALNTTGGAIINFGNAATPTGATIAVVGINATANTTWTPGGTLGTGGTVAPIDVAPGITLNLAGQALSTAGGTGFSKSGTGTLVITSGGTYSGGFTLNDGTMIVGGVNAMGGGATNTLTLNAGILSANSGTARTFTNKFPNGITIGGNIQIGEDPIVNASAGVGNLTFTNNVSLGAVNRTLTLGNSGTHTFSGIISNTSGGLTFAANVNGTGSFLISGANTYSDGTTITGGSLICGAANTIPSAGTLTLSGGTLRTGATTGFTQSTGTLLLTANSTLNLGTGVHSINFLNSSAELWTGGALLTITGWTGGYNGTTGTAGQIFVGTDATGLTAGQLAQIQFYDGANFFPAVILPTGEVVAGASAVVADIVLSSPNPAVPIGNIAQGTTSAINNPIYEFDLAVTTANATLTGVTINTAGTYAATDITNFKCWYSADNVFSPLTDQLLSTIATPAVAGPQVFTPFTNQVINSGTSGYFFITADVPCVAVIGNDISVNAITTADLSFSSGNKSGIAVAGGLQTIIAGIPNNVAGPAASVANASSSLSWPAPAGCYDDVLIVAATATNTWVPTGTTYPGASLVFAAGTPLGNGFAVYQGTASPQVVTGLTNGTPYFYKFFTRLGSVWSTGVEISQTPAVVSSATDYFRSVAPGGNWNSTTTWESSPDNATWIPATLVPTATANTITIQNTANVTVNATAGGDQLVVDAGATLTFNANFTLADGTGTDLDVNGTVVNSAGTVNFTGTASFNAGSVYQHNRNGGAAPTASWNINSLFEVTGATSSAPTNITQTLGNFTWNSNTTSTTNLVGTLTTVAGNFRVQNSGTAALRLSGTADLNLTVAGNFTIEDDLDIDNNATGVCNISIGGNFSQTAGNFGSSTDVATITMTGVNKTFTQSGGTFNGSNIDWIINTGASITLNNNLTLGNAARTMTINGTLDCGILAVNGAGAITITNGGRAKVGSLNAAGAVADNLSASAGLTLNTGSTIEFSGLAAQFAAPRTFSNLTINNANGVTLTGAVIVNDILNLTSGNMTTTGANLLTLTATASVAGVSNASFVNGPISKIGNTDFVFPTGKTNCGPSGTVNGYAAIEITAFTGGLVTDQFTAEYIRASAYTIGTNTIGVDHISRCDYWTLTRDGATVSTVDITLHWTDPVNNCVTTAPYINSIASLTVVHNDNVGGNWDAMGSVGGFGTGAAGFVPWTGAQSTTFGAFAIASTDFNNPLPITINYFNGIKQNGNHLLNWKVTCTSTPFATIEMERSIDGRNYSSIYSIYATALRCQQPFDYTDASPAAGVNYYRLKMTDANGKITYSSTVSLLNASKGIDILSIAPNPIVGGKFDLRVSAAQKTQMDIIITDMQGRVMQKRTVSMIAGFNAIPVNVSRFATGTYQVYGTTADGRSKVLRFVVQ